LLAVGLGYTETLIELKSVTPKTLSVTITLPRVA
jgi:hypothetical protein